jgi:quercetin dioxygenase-like cupin family protein
MLPLLSLAQNIPAGTIQLCPGKIEWKEAPPPFAKGARIAVLEGDPKKEGYFTIRFEMPAHFRIPPHFHGKEERVTVISGRVSIGFGDSADTSNATEFTSGCYYVNPANSHHYVFTGNETAILQISGNGPWGIIFLDEK